MRQKAEKQRKVERELQENIRGALCNTLSKVFDDSLVMANYEIRAIKDE